MPRKLRQTAAFIVTRGKAGHMTSAGGWVLVGMGSALRLGTPPEEPAE